MQVQNDTHPFRIYIVLYLHSQSFFVMCNLHQLVCALTFSSLIAVVSVNIETFYPAQNQTRSIWLTLNYVDEANGSSSAKWNEQLVDSSDIREVIYMPSSSRVVKIPFVTSNKITALTKKFPMLKSYGNTINNQIKQIIAHSALMSNCRRNLCQN